MNFKIFMTHDHTWYLTIDPGTDQMIILTFATKNIMMLYISNYLGRG
jgi:hypothetical protein